MTVKDFLINFPLTTIFTNITAMKIISCFVIVIFIINPTHETNHPL